MLTDGKKAIASNVVLMFLFQLAGAATPLLVFPHLFRVLGEDGFGHLTYAYTTAVALSIVVEYGFNFTAVREVARCRDDRTARSVVFLNTQAGKFLMLVPALIGYFGLCVMGAGLDPLMAAAGSPLLLAMAILPLWFYQGLERIGLPVALIVIGRLSAVAGVLLVVTEPSDLTLALAVLSSGMFLPALLLSILVRREVSLSQTVRLKRNVFDTLLRGRFVFVSNLCGAMIVQGPVVLLGLFLAPASVGIYAAIDKLCFMLRFSYLPINRALFPSFSRVFAARPEHAFRRLLIVSALGASGLAVIGLVAHLWRIEIVTLYLGVASPDALALFSLLIFVPVATFLRSCAVTLGMLPMGKDRIQMLFQIAGGGVLLGAFFLIGSAGTLSVFAYVVAGLEWVLTILSWLMLTWMMTRNRVSNEVKET